MALPQLLAPLQQIMLRDSRVNGKPQAHLEQLEIVFHPFISAAQMAHAWTTLLTHTEVLQMAFSSPDDAPASWHLVDQHISFISPTESPELLSEWLEQDRKIPLVLSDIPPWRTIYWASQQRLVWTFHHALLDGRSITAIVARLLALLEGNYCFTACAVTRWTPPDAPMLRMAEQYFRESFQGYSPSHTCLPPPRLHPKQIAFLDQHLAEELETLSQQLEVSTATLILWAWAQSVAYVAEQAFAFCEQIRCGAPQYDCLGFTMNTLPLLIPQATHGNEKQEIQALRKQLIFLRQIETISPSKLPLEIQQMALSPWASVIMIESYSIENLAITYPAIRSIKLHEAPTTSLTASAYLSPHIRLEVEGPANHELLTQWVDILILLVRHSP